MIKILIAILAAASFAGAEEIKIDFDGKPGARGGVQVSELIGTAADITVPEAAAKEASRISNRGWQNRKVCKTVELDSRDGASINRRVGLQAVYSWEECVDVSGMVDGVYSTWSVCKDKHQWVDADVDLVIHNRELRQYDKEKIEVCYDFQSKKGSFVIRQSPFEYTYRDKNSDWRYSVELFPNGRKPQKPEASLAELASFSYDDVRKEFTLTVRNQFTGDYDGGKVHIGVELVQDKLFDSSKGTKFFEFPLNWLRQDFKATFKLSDFASEKDAAEFRAKADKYFVNWGFKVKKQGFTEDYIEKGKSAAVSVIK
ncbi:MAG TPA: hypothetical protein DDW67_10060 [Elusimicrobia bacterium]|nr:hypothetical protein [Elusimicrobiota bacterium]